jgi:hypothetical protein
MWAIEADMDDAMEKAAHKDSPPHARGTWLLL